MATLIFRGGQWVIRSDWHEEDILIQCENKGINLTDHQVYKVMLLIVASHDANIGINWEVIDNAIDQVSEES
jgi:hypothetical protein